MKDRILRLCKRLNKCSLDELELVSDLDSEELLSILNTLVSEAKLTEYDGEYYYCKKISVAFKYPLLKKYPAFIIDMVIRCFCEFLNSYKTANITGLSAEQIQKLYTIFRTLIYERQKKY